MNYIKGMCVPMLISAVMIVALTGVCAAGQGSDIIFRAMQDELARTVADLVMEDLERPYFVSYTIDDVQNLTVVGSLGTLTRSRLERNRRLTVELRVGGPSLDNSNFASGFNMPRPHYSTIPVDDDYDALRNRIYLSTDGVYKDALRDISRKRAYLQTRVLKNRPDDFIMQPANEFTDRVEEFDLDPAYIEGLIRSASRVFRNYPMIVSSELTITGGINNQYFINSAGSQSIRGDRLYVINLAMSGKSGEGEDVTDAGRIIVNKPGDLPDASELARWATANAERMKALVTAETIEEYAGPVILSGEAAGEFLRQLFAKHVSNIPSPLFENEQMAQMVPAPEFANKVKRRVLPAFMDVYDDPTIDQIGDLPLIGGYGVDDAGGVPQRVQLVEEGKLVGLLIGTAPTKKIKEPNGHARGAVSKSVTAKPANLIFESADQVSDEELVGAMLELCQDVDLEYGLVITKLTDLNAPRPRSVYFGRSSGQESALTAPLEAYKVYADGRREPVRNLEFSNVTVRTLRDILQTGDQPHAYHYLIGNDYEMPVSVVCPSILIEEMELKKTEAKIKTPPVLASPLAEK